MNNIAVSNIRNFLVLGHAGSGKTSLTDALLFKIGLNDRLGSVDSGSSMADYTDQEKSHKTTIFAKSFSGSCKTSDGSDLGLIFTDTPGYADFFGQVIATGKAAETGLFTIDAVSGIQVGTLRAWKLCKKNNLARSIVITGIDKDNADFSKTVKAIQESFGKNCLPVVLPCSDGKTLIDVLSDKNIPEDITLQVEEAKNNLIELASETDDSLIEKFLGGEELSPEEIANGLRVAVVEGGLIPIFACSSKKDIGISELIEGIKRLFPSPCDRKTKDTSGNIIGTSKDDPFVGQVWRTVNDAFVGQLTFVRVFGGTLKSDSEIQNTSKKIKERIGSLLLVNGKKQESISSACPGDIIAIPKLKDTSVGDTLCNAGSQTVCENIVFPAPVMFQAVTAKTQADEDKIGVALARVAEEDPTLKVQHNKETKETLISGLGDVHIEIAVELMKQRSNVNVTLATPKVAYRETITAMGEGHYKHKKQSGGRGQYGEVYLRVEPLPDGEEDWFINAIVGGVIPGNFIPAVQKGLVEGKASGSIAGYPVENVKITVYDGSYHDVDSSEIAFKIAASRAFKEAMSKAKPVLLEPIMSVKIMIPDHCMGDINGDLNHKRGRILGMSSEDGMQVITADVPQTELFRYAAELRSITAGQGSFEMEFSRYENVPANITQKIIATVEKEKEEK